jgi:hypothetical protein
MPEQELIPASQKPIKNAAIGPHKTGRWHEIPWYAISAMAG